MRVIAWFWSFNNRIFLMKVVKPRIHRLFKTVEIKNYSIGVDKTQTEAAQSMNPWSEVREHWSLFAMLLDHQRETGFARIHLCHKAVIG